MDNSTVQVLGELTTPAVVRNGTQSTSTEMFVDEADDAIWILTSTFIIFTMQSGFGLLESGTVTSKNEVNIMIKNAVDVIVGGMSYWMFGYAFSFGNAKWSNPFSGWGTFFVTANEKNLGSLYSKFFFQASFATTATTIVSGAMAERTKLEAYLFFSFVNTLVFCFPAHWVWGEDGWLKALGMVDIAGAGPVHLVGGVTGLVATLLLKPRHGRFSREDGEESLTMGSPTNALLGMFMLWWGWLGFNCGSTFGISGFKWKLAARSAVATIMSPIGGGTAALVVRSAVSTLFGSMSGGLVALSTSYIFKKRKFEVEYVINGILGGLVSITGHCALAEPWEALVIGSIGAMLTLGTIELLAKVRIDDPVGVVGVHAVGGIWSLISVGIFSRDDKLSGALSISHNQVGLIYGGGFKLLGIQVAGIVSIATWSAVTSFLILYVIDRIMTIRVPLQREILGADVVEHSIGDIQYDKMQNKIIAYRRRGIKGGIVAEVFNRLVDSANGDKHGLERLVYMNSLNNKNHARSLTECFCDHPVPQDRGKAYLRDSAKAKSNGVVKPTSSSAASVEDDESKIAHTACGLCGRLAYYRQSETVYKENCEENHTEQNGDIERHASIDMGGDFAYENDAFDEVISISTLSIRDDVTRRNDDVIQTVHL